MEVACLVSVAFSLVLAVPPQRSTQQPLREPAARNVPQERVGAAFEPAYTEPFFAGASYDPEIPSPDAILGHPHAARLSHHAEILACFRRWADLSPRVRTQTFGFTHEGRELVHAVITSPENHARLDDIRSALARLHDARGLSEAEGERLVRDTPPVAWLGYSIHGDETSGADASLGIGYHLIASTDAEVEQLLSRIVVVIDPVMNPDGRERILGMVEQQVGRVTSLDWDSMVRGRWPYGRGNHYLFDMNRDWMAGTQPETRARWRAILSFHPQLLVDAHEMDSFDTFLFYPQEEPLNPFLPDRHAAWLGTFGAGIAQAFDRHGWDYYTREWADGWGPFYSDAWGSLTGATGMLYEQARTIGTPLRRASGRILTYRESVHHQAVASLANLETLAEHRQELMRDYLAQARRAVDAETPGNDRAFALVPSGRTSRERELLRILVEQDVEVLRATRGFRAEDVQDRFGATLETRDLPAGTWLVPARQPMHGLVRAFLEFDTRMDKDALLAERVDLERKGRSRIYDSTSWSLPLAFDLDGAWIDAPEVPTERLTALAAAPAFPTFDAAQPPVAWVVDGRDDSSVAFALQAMELGLAVHAGDVDFRSNEHDFARGSVIVRRHENEGGAEAIDALVRRAAERSGAAVFTSTSGRSPDEGPDLGGQHFRLLARPRIALVSNTAAPDTFGHLWYWLDVVLGAPIAILDGRALGSYDLRRYNGLVLPESWGDIEDALEPVKEELEAWVRGGGTLVACSDAAAALTSGKLGLSAVKLREDALEELDSYTRQAERERAAREIEIDEALVWGEARTEEDGDDEKGEAAGEKEDEQASAATEDEGTDKEARKERDRWLARFSPYGVTLRGAADEFAWITAGADAELPVFFAGSSVFLAKDPVRTAVRLAGVERLRVAGLVWPEARERIADSAWLTVEGKGDGQISLFASMPAFRGYHLATARLFANAVVLGPGLGASQPLGW